MTIRLTKIGENLDFYIRSSGETVNWQTEHQQALACFDLEDLIDYGLWVISSIRRYNDGWASAIENSKCTFSWDDATGFGQAYQKWLDTSERVLAVARAFEAQGYDVRRSGDLEEAISDVKLMSLDTSRARSALESLERGEGVSQQQALDGLRNRLRPAGA